MKIHTKQQIKWIIQTGLLNITGLLIFKYLPMYLNYLKNGTSEILYDASSHVAWTIFGLYFIWFFIDDNKSWRIPYFIFSCGVVVIMAIQRIIVGEHNEFGVLMGMLVAVFSIIIPRWNEFAGRMKW